MGLAATKPLAGAITALVTWISEVHDTINAILDPHTWRLSLSATSCTSGVDTKLSYTNDAIAPVGVTVNAGKNRVTFNKAGRYQMRASTRWPTGGTANTETQTVIRRYNSGNTIQEVLPQGSGSASNGVATNCASGSMIVAAGDYVEVWTFQSSGGAKAPDNGPTVQLGWTMFEGRWVGTS